MTSRPIRILQVAHGHRSLNPGGTEVFSHRLHQEALLAGFDSWYLGAAEDKTFIPNKGTSMVALTADQREAVLHTPVFNRFELQQPDGFGVLRDLRTYLVELDPDVVHVHHVLNFGLELIFLIKANLPKARIVFTAHDYYAICANNGQLYKHHTEQRCDGPGLRECRTCLPERTENDFALRRLNVENALAQCDAIVSPSHFLADKLMANLNLPQAVSVIENGYCGPLTNRDVAPREKPADRPVRFGFFGNISKLKGVELLLDAMEIAFYEGDRFELHVHGSQLLNDGKLADRLANLREKLGRRVTLNGKYEAAAIPELMASVDCVIVPSIWWENAPLILYEALYCGKPVIAFPFGGMKELLERYETGIFPAQASATGLYDAMRHYVRNPEPTSTSIEVRTVRDALGDYLRLYEAG